MKPANGKIEQWLIEKSAILSKAQAFTTMGLIETAEPLWATAAGYEERIASMLDANGDTLEAAVHWVSAASCFQKAGDSLRAASLFRAALAGPLRETNRKEVEAMLVECLARLND